MKCLHVLFTCVLLTGCQPVLGGKPLNTQPSSSPIRPTASPLSSERPFSPSPAVSTGAVPSTQSSPSLVPGPGPSPTPRPSPALTPAAQQVVKAVNQLGYRLLELQLGDKLELTENRVFSPVLAMQQLLKWGQTRPMAEQVILSESLGLGTLSLQEADSVLKEWVHYITNLDTEHLWQFSSENESPSNISFELNWSTNTRLSYKHPALTDDFTFANSTGTETKKVLQVFGYFLGQKSGRLYRVFMPEGTPFYNLTVFEMPPSTLPSELKKYLRSSAQSIRETLFGAESYLSLQQKFSPIETMRLSLPRFDLKQNLNLGATIPKLTQNRLTVSGTGILLQASVRLDPMGSEDWYSRLQQERQADGPLFLTHVIRNAFAFQIFQPDTGLYLMMGVLANPELASVPPAVSPTTSP